MKKKITPFDIANTLIMGSVILMTLVPFLWLAATSFSSGAAVAAGKVSIFPIGFNTKSYEMIFNQPTFWTGYQNTILYTVLGTIISLVLTTLCAYPLAKSNLPGRGALMGFFVLTMFVQGGIIPSYLVVRALGMRNTIWAVILPGAISTYNMIVMRTFFQTIPQGLEESAVIDGLNPFGVLLRIVLPLSKPIMATMTMFYAVLKWNAWFKPMLYLDNPKMFPVSLFLRNVVFSTQTTLRESGSITSADMTNIYMTIKSTSIILVVLPILCIYPFIQKYFVKGMMIGSIKG